jgi:hypothetical protein
MKIRPNGLYYWRVIIVCVQQYVINRTIVQTNRCVPCMKRPIFITLEAEVTYGVRSPKFIWVPVYSCPHWLRRRNSPPPPRHLGLYTRALLVSQDRRRLFVTPWLGSISKTYLVFTSAGKKSEVSIEGQVTRAITCGTQTCEDLTQI